MLKSNLNIYIKHKSSEKKYFDYLPKKDEK